MQVSELGYFPKSIGYIGAVYFYGIKSQSLFYSINEVIKMFLKIKYLLIIANTVTKKW